MNINVLSNDINIRFVIKWFYLSLSGTFSSLLKMNN